ncbi:hypothetical protein F8M41_017321 [Gigaspora margarita]|uniref:Uncharacterized protein n=1 Tax=Gigaspora margarita TaxID=4874 RepID=A0A8H4AN83_GIGMA|nr:hypothetical protein F8M41_017321 [Gigaspora margarita]
MTEEQIEDNLKNAEETLRVTIPRNTETKREAVYEYLRGLADTNDATIYQQRKKIKEIEEEYERDTSPAITITKEQFARTIPWDQRNVLNDLIYGAAHSQNETIRQEHHNKYMELLTAQAEQMGEMITEQREIANEQWLRRAESAQRPNLKKLEKLPLPNKMYRDTYTTEQPFRERDDDDNESVRSDATDKTNTSWTGRIKLPSLPKSPISFKFPGNWTTTKQ